MSNRIEDTYERPTQVEIKVPASMLDAIYGWEDEERVDRELAFALDAVDTKDPATLQWLVAVIEGKLNYMGRNA